MASAPDRHVRGFGQAVRARRGEMGISQEELGFRAKIHRTYVSDVERGTRNPTVKVIWKLALALETRPSALFRYSEERLARAPQS